MNVDVYDNPEELAQAAAREFADKAAEAIGERGRFAVVLAGGSTPKTTYDILARDYGDRVDWKDVHVFFGDERGVPPDNDDSNYKMAMESLLDHVTIGSVHRMQGELSPDEAAEAYERDLRDFFGPVDLPEFDLILLGTGPDGHTASLFPETSALEVHDRWVVANPVLKLETTRITLTLPAINAAKNIFFLVAGEGKAAPVAEILQGAPDPRQYPASLIQPENGPTWMLDQAAASGLT